MAVLYLLSGITIVKPDEVAVILRWGRLVGSTPALQEHGPGLLFALPQPVDEVVRVQVKRVSEVQVMTLMDTAGEGDDDDEETNADLSSLNPLQGYAITGDHNIVHVNMMASIPRARARRMGFLWREIRRYPAGRSYGGNGSLPRRDGSRPGARRRPEGPDRADHASRAGRFGRVAVGSRARVARTHQPDSANGAGGRVRRGAECIHRGRN